MPLYKVHAPGENRDDALVCEFDHEKQAAERYAEQLRKADDERFGYSWRTDYTVLVRVPGGPAKRFEVAFPKPHTVVTEV